MLTHYEQVLFKFVKVDVVLKRLDGWLYRMPHCIVDALSQTIFLIPVHSNALHRVVDYSNKYSASNACEIKIVRISSSTKLLMWGGEKLYFTSIWK